ncbi:MAG: histidine kinase [bacterium]
MCPPTEPLSATDVPGWSLRTRLIAWSIPALLGALFSQSAMTGKPGDPARWQVTVIAMLTWYVWVVLTPIVTRYLDRRPVGASTGLVRLARTHVIPAVLVTAAQSMTTALSTVLVGLASWRAIPMIFAGWYLALLPAGVVVYVAVVALRGGLVQRARLDFRTRQAEALAQQLRDAQLHAMRAQMQPHFLFNTLTAITALVRDAETARAVDALERLSALLRSALRAGDAHEVSLEEEMRWLRDYLAIEELRLGHDLTLTVSVPSELWSARVPSWILQPIVENAVRHGLRPRRGPGSLRIAASNDASLLTIDITDNGVGLSSDWESRMSMGYGVANTRARLAQLYGAQGELTMSTAGGGGTCVRLTLPVRMS